MTDSRLRLAERRAASGGVADEAALLVERLRVEPACGACGGDGLARRLVGKQERLKAPCPACAGSGSPLRGRVELAAFLGDPAARSVSRVPFGPVVWDGVRGLNPETLSLVEWLRLLSSRWAGLTDRDSKPSNVMVRAAVAAARVALPVWCDSTRLSGRTGLHAGRVAKEGHCGRCTVRILGDARPGDAVEVVESWLAFPCEERRQDCAGVGGSPSAVHDLPEGFYELVEMVALGYFDGTSDVVGMRGAVSHFVALAGEAPVRAGVCSSLVSWARPAGWLVA